VPGRCRDDLHSMWRRVPCPLGEHGGITEPSCASGRNCGRQTISSPFDHLRIPRAARLQALDHEAPLWAAKMRGYPQRCSDPSVADNTGTPAAIAAARAGTMPTARSTSASGPTKVNQRSRSAGRTRRFAEKKIHNPDESSPRPTSWPRKHPSVIEVGCGPLPTGQSLLAHARADCRVVLGRKPPTVGCRVRLRVRMIRTRSHRGSRSVRWRSSVAARVRDRPWLLGFRSLRHARPYFPVSYRDSGDDRRLRLMPEAFFTVDGDSYVPAC